MSDRGGDDGFTLIEALASLVVMAVILTGLATLAGQWLPSWRHGFVTLEAADLIGLALDRVVEDVASAEYARLDGGDDGPLFRGDRDAIVFVRSSVGPGAGPRLEIVRIAERQTSQGAELQRAHASFTPGAIGAFRDAVALLHSPFRLAFAYAGPDGQWRTSWNGGRKLPRTVRLTVQAQNGATVASTAFALKITDAPEIAAPPQQPDASATPATGNTQ